MKSSLLPNEIQDIEGLELKEQVKVLRDYIEYMREQLRWYNDVTDRADGEFIQGVTTYYGKSNSQTTPPSQWSKEAPALSDGEYLWQYTKVTRSGVTTRSDPVCISSASSDGEDAALIYIHSSNGTIFRADNTGTVLTVTIYYGSDAIRTLSNLQTAFGASAHLEWYERAYGSSTYTQITDSRISDNGFTLTLTSTDVADRATYNCRLMLSASETRSQSSITITDIEDGQLLYATSSTAAATAAKTATLQSGALDLQAGAAVAVTFANANTVANPTLNIDNTGAKAIRAGNAGLTADSKYNWTANATVIFIYDGTYWQMDGTAQLEKADDARKVATDYITDVPNDDGITVSGNNATAEVLITDKVRVQADFTHFTDVESTGMKVYSGTATNPAAYFEADEAGLAGDGAGNYFVHIYEYAPTSGVSGGAIDLHNTDGNRRVRLNAMGDYGQAVFYNELELPLAVIGADDKGTLVLTQSNSAGQMTQLAYIGLTDSVFQSVVAAGQPVICMNTAQNSEGGSFLRAMYGGGWAWINNGLGQGFVVHGQSVNHKMTLDCDTSSGYVAFYADGAAIGAIPVGSSDRRTKTDIEPIQDKYKRAALKVELKDFRYDFNDKVLSGVNNLLRFGVIAQDVIEALGSEGIRENESELIGTLKDENSERYIVNYVPFLVARLAADEDRIRELETRLEALERR